MKRFRPVLALCAFGFAAFASAANARPACPKQAPGDVADAMRAMYAAVAAGDTVAVRARLAPDFYAFEAGVRMDGMTLPDMVEKSRAAGMIHQWNVTQPDVQMRCDLAAIAYVNVGAVGDASGVKPVTWLESATLRYEDGRWRILFLNSTRAPAAH